MTKCAHLALLCTFLLINLAHEIASHPTHGIQTRDQAKVRTIFKRALEINAQVIPKIPRPVITRSPIAPFTSPTGSFGGDNSWTSQSGPFYTTQRQPFSTGPQQQTTTNTWTSTARPFQTTQKNWNQSTQRPAIMVSIPTFSQPPRNLSFVALVEVQPKSNYSIEWSSTPSYPQWNATSTGWWYYNSSSSTWSSPQWYSNYTSTPYYPQWNSSTTDWWYSNYTSTPYYPQWNETSTGWWYYNSSSSTWYYPQWNSSTTDWWYSNYTSTPYYPQWNETSTGWWYYNSSSSTWSSPTWYNNYTSTWTYPQSNTTYPTGIASKKNSVDLNLNVNIDIQVNGQHLGDFSKYLKLEQEK